MSCPSCGNDNRPEAKFCQTCGAALARACPNGHPVPAEARFCDECGAAVEGPPHVASAPAATAQAPAAERRLVSVLFADLVSFTTLSETRDAEEVRELLSRYFETARTTIERYGGTVEKFIGDAVMAVWGTPVAREDDAERAVRAGLELVDAVGTFGAEVGAPDLAARAGVVTGEAAVTIGAEGEGMVAGDLVNTASRIQSAAEPVTVLVGEGTKRATEAAIAYEEAGTHELKGKAEPVALWRALRVVAGRGGEGRSVGLEAPFVGRDRELRLVKDIFHATAADRRATLVSVVGVAGIGKSRLAWEFEKYIDGVAETVFWHRGRCLSYGDGVAYWALAEMVRGRAGITEDEDESSALTKLQRTASEYLPDSEEREWVEPRLQHLLGLTERTAPNKEDLFGAWRLLFERIAERGPVVLVFEDLHWADAGLLDFVEYLLDWSRAHPIYVLALARPDLGERMPGFGTRVRSTTTLVLEPISDEAMDQLLLGLVPGLPDDVRARIRERADGIPLYGVETVRMLLDRGLLEEGPGGYQLTGPAEALDVPETLHALIAARLDALEPPERTALERAAVLGKTFTPRGLAAVSGLSEDEVAPLLASLVRKEVLYLDADPRSPERGQYGFLQALVQRVAYETLSRRDRKTAHLASARFLSESAGMDPDEIAEVIAAHYVDAYEADPGAEDAAEIKATACDWLCRAGERAASLAATDDARRAFDAATALVDDPQERARLLERAGELALAGDDQEAALERLERARGIFAEAGIPHAAARATATLSIALWGLGRGKDALDLLEPALDLLARDEPDEDVATLAAEAARIHTFQADTDRAMQRVEQALTIAESNGYPAVISDGLNTKALLLKTRPSEAHALMREALAIALDHDLVHQALRGYNNLSVLLGNADRPDDARRATEEGFELARARGHRQFAVSFGLSLCNFRISDGDWEGAFTLADELPLHSETAVASHVAGCTSLAATAFERGEEEVADRWLGMISPEVDASTDIQLRMLAAWRDALVATHQRRYDDALAGFEEGIRILLSQGFVDFTSASLQYAATVAQALGDPERAVAVAGLLDAVPPARLTRAVELELARIRANVAAARGDLDGAADGYAASLSIARNLGKPPTLGPVLVDYARWLVETDRAEESEPLLAEARGLYEKMGAVVWLERIAAVEERLAEKVTS